MSKSATIIPLIALLMLAACGGGGGGPPVAPAVIPTASALIVSAQPVTTTAGTVISIEVSTVDDTGAVIDSGAAVTVEIVGPGAPALLGTTVRNAVAGIATFDDLRIEVAAKGYALRVLAAGLTSAESDPCPARWVAS